MMAARRVATSSGTPESGVIVWAEAAVATARPARARRTRIMATILRPAGQQAGRGGQMISRREVVTAGVLGTLATAGNAGAAEVQQDVQTLKEGFKALEDTIKGLQ